MVTKSTQHLVEKLHQEGRQEFSGTMSQRLISKLERRFPDFPDSLKDRIRQVTDANKMFDLIACAASVHSPEEFARQMAV